MAVTFELYNLIFLTDMEQFCCHFNTLISTSSWINETNDGIVFESISTILVMSCIWSIISVWNIALMTGDNLLNASLLTGTATLSEQTRVKSLVVSKWIFWSTSAVALWKVTILGQRSDSEATSLILNWESIIN